MAATVRELQQLQHRERKACCFSGARLRASEYIFASQYQRYGLLLNRGSLVVALFFYCLQKFSREAEIFK